MKSDRRRLPQKAGLRSAAAWILDRDLTKVRREFPIVGRCVYLISNSLGAMPRSARFRLQEFISVWEREGVTAWQKEWWDLGLRVGDRLAKLIGASAGQVTMMNNATQAHWVALSTQFLPSARGRRHKVVMSDQDFPSSLYAVEALGRAMGWQTLVVPASRTGLDPDPLLRAIDDKTLFVATSHVHFKTSSIQDIKAVCRRARSLGALTLIDGYHAPGVIPVDVRELGADFYIGGCLKWLCGGPGTAFLYVRPEIAATAKPLLAGWAGHRRPFLFSAKLDYAPKSARFQSGTPAVPCLYAAQAGLEIIERIGLPQIRRKSLKLTGKIMDLAEERGFPLLTPRESNQRGGHVAFHVPHAFQLKQALEAKGIKLDYRKGGEDEPDLLRVGPHFYNKEEEVEVLFRELDRLRSSGAYKKYSSSIKSVT
ncbi:MAG TPA: aminotransferase class V-fold PLP-dependent enzyme [Acidobacteriota bacterium]